jgi:hypothetical protein
MSLLLHEIDQTGLRKGKIWVDTTITIVSSRRDVGGEIEEEEDTRQQNDHTAESGRKTNVEIGGLSQQANTQVNTSS